MTVFVSIGKRIADLGYLDMFRDFAHDEATFKELMDVRVINDGQRYTYYVKCPVCGQQGMWELTASVETIDEVYDALEAHLEQCAATPFDKTKQQIAASVAASVVSASRIFHDAAEKISAASRGVRADRIVMDEAARFGEPEIPYTEEERALLRELEDEELSKGVWATISGAAQVQPLTIDQLFPNVPIKTSNVTFRKSIEPPQDMWVKSINKYDKKRKREYKEFLLQKAFGVGIADLDTAEFQGILEEAILHDLLEYRSKATVALFMDRVYALTDVNYGLGQSSATRNRWSTQEAANTHQYAPYLVPRVVAQVVFNVKSKQWRDLNSDKYGAITVPMGMLTNWKVWV